MIQIIILLLFIPSLLWAAPSITGINGTLSNGQSITITGSGFGATGPTVVLFDDFEKGTNGNDVSVSENGAQIGTWSYEQPAENYLPYPIYSTAYANSGSKSMFSTFLREGGNTPHMLIHFSATDGIFFSYKQYLPVGKDVPGTNGGGGANWKLWWLWGATWPDSDFLPVFLDNTLPMQEAYATWGAADDQDSPARYDGTWWASQFTRGQWMRWHFYAKGGQTDGAVGFYEVRPDGIYTISSASNVYTMHPGELWQNLTFPGYGRDDNNAVVYIDDVYVATGSAAQARVEIGNSSTYTSNSNIATFTPTSWSDTSITATVRNGSFTSGTVYLAVTDSSGSTTTYATPLTYGATYGETAPSTVSGCTISGGATRH